MNNNSPSAAIAFIVLMAFLALGVFISKDNLFPPDIQVPTNPAAQSSGTSVVPDHVATATAIYSGINTMMANVAATQTSMSQTQTAMPLIAPDPVTLSTPSSPDFNVVEDAANFIPVTGGNENNNEEPHSPPSPLWALVIPGTGVLLTALYTIISKQREREALAKAKQIIEERRKLEVEASAMVRRRQIDRERQLEIATMQYVPPEKKHRFDLPIAQ